MERDTRSKDGDLILLGLIKFVNIGAINCLLGLMAVHVNQTPEWWTERMGNEAHTRQLLNM